MKLITYLKTYREDKMKKLKFIKLACLAVNYEIIKRPVTLADILIATGKKLNIGLVSNGGFAEFTLDNKNTDIWWNLKRSLEEQDKETINYIYKLLKL